MCDPPRIYPSLPESTPLFNQFVCATLPESPPPPPENIPPFSATICDPSRIDTFLEYTTLSTYVYVQMDSHNIIVVEKGVYSGRKGWIMGGSHIVLENGVDLGAEYTSYNHNKGGGGRFWEGGVDCGSYRNLPWEYSLGYTRGGGA